jgi:hypothetical protein
VRGVVNGLGCSSSSSSSRGCQRQYFIELGLRVRHSPS